MTMFRYEYVDPAEFSAKKLLKEGMGIFEVMQVIDTDANGYPLKSKAGADMLKLVLRVTDCQMSTSLVDDYLVATVQFKIKEFADSVGLPGMYGRNGVIEPKKLVGLKGKCNIKNESYTGRDGTTRESSKIGSYLMKIQGIPLGQGIDPDDAIPF